MFRTFPEAELPLPTGLAKNGERSWYWIELPLQISYFMATILIADGNQKLRKTMLFSDIHTVLQVACERAEKMTLERVEVLIPGYLHQEDGYRMARIKEVWMSTDKRMTSYVLADNSKVYDAPYLEGDMKNANLELVAIL